MLRCPPWNELLQVKESGAAEHDPKPSRVPGDVEFGAAVDQITQGRCVAVGKMAGVAGPVGVGDGSGTLGLPTRCYRSCETNVSLRMTLLQFQN